MRHRIARIDLHGALKAEQRLAPEIHPGHLHTEVVLARRLPQILMMRTCGSDCENRKRREEPI